MEPSPVGGRKACSCEYRGHVVQFELGLNASGMKMFGVKGHMRW